MKVRITHFIVLLSGLFFLAGCSLSPVYKVDISSIDSPVAQGAQSFVVMPSSSDVNVDDLQFQEFARYVSDVLEKEGFSKASERDVPDMVIFLSYGVSQPRVKQYSQAVPLYGRTGTHAVTQTTEIKSDDGSSKTVHRTQYRPSYGVTGYTSQLRSVTTYLSDIELVAVDYALFKEDGRRKQLWKTSIATESESNDLRHLFPIMLVAAKNYIGKNTEQKIRVEVGEDEVQ